MSPTKVRVKKSDLIAVIEKRRDEARAAHATLLEEYPALLAAWQERTVAYLEDAKDTIIAGKVLDYRWKDGIPVHPSKPVAFGVIKYDTHIAMLNMATDEIITVSADDFGEYLR